MKNLIYETEDFPNIKKTIVEYIGNYSDILNELETIGNNVEYAWESEAEKSFYELFFQKKKELDNLLEHYENLEKCIETVESTYENIENNYI